MNFSDFALRPEILQAIEDAGYKTPTPIQEQAIPTILAGHDVLGIAQTGTGKTAAFVLPMIERLAQGQAKARMPRSLILSPTRELATQTAAYFETYGKHLRLNMALLIGGVGMEEQAKKLERGVDVLIATPGRLLDQFERGRILLGGLTILVVDEADRMLDMGFIPDVERIVKLLIRREQTLMFSATMPKEVRRLADTFLSHPKELQAAPPATRAEGVKDHLAVVPPRHKFDALKRLIETQEVGKAIIFCNRKREVSSLRRQLERAGMNVRDIHGDLDQSQRTQALDAFKRGEIDFLVATDVAARGLDIAMLPCVINYDVPLHADDYVHRIGRTARAGQEGRAYTLALPEDGRFVDAITKLTGRSIPLLDIPGLEQPALTADAKGRGRRGRTAAKAEPGESNGKSANGHATTGEDQVPAEKAPPAERRSRRARSKPRAQEEVVPTDRVSDTAASAAAGEPETMRTGRVRDERRSAPAHTERVSKEAAGEPETMRTGRVRNERRSAPAKHEEGATPERGSSDRRPEPVVGMGDHVPLFMRRPVPLASLGSTDGEA